MKRFIPTRRIATGTVALAIVAGFNVTTNAEDRNIYHVPERLPIAMLSDIEAALRNNNEWVSYVENDKASTLAGLSPAAVSGTLKVAVGRVRKLKLGPEFLSLFTVGDQLLWGAAEPLRRMLRILREAA